MRLFIEELFEDSVDPKFIEDLKNEVKDLHKSGMSVEDITKKLEDEHYLVYDNEHHAFHVEVVTDIILGKHAYDRYTGKQMF